MVTRRGRVHEHVHADRAAEHRGLNHESRDRTGELVGITEAGFPCPAHDGPLPKLGPKHAGRDSKMECRPHRLALTGSPSHRLPANDGEPVGDGNQRECHHRDDRRAVDPTFDGRDQHGRRERRRGAEGPVLGEHRRP